MAGPPQEKAEKSDNIADTSLTIEGDQATQLQAQFSRLQQALGLREELTTRGLCDSYYGANLEPLDPIKPTGITRQGDVIILSLDLKVRYKEGMLVNIRWGVRSFDTALLNDVSPSEYTAQLQKSHTFGGGYDTSSTTPKRAIYDSTLGIIRRAIIDTFEPLCLDHCTNAAHQNDYMDLEQSSQDMLKFCNGRRAQCADASHDDQNNYDHTLHQACKARRNVVLLLSEKEQCLGNLKLLGCDPHEHLHVVDVVSLEELYQVHLARADYYRRKPTTGGRRTLMHHDWKDISTFDEIVSNLGFDPTFAGGARQARRQRTLLQLKAAVEMAIGDALAPGWLRTRAQIDGGAFPGPWLKLSNKDEVIAFLVEYDVARGYPDTFAALKERASSLSKAIPLMSRSLQDTYLKQLARVHNYEHLLNQVLTKSKEISSDNTVKRNTASTSETPGSSSSAASALVTSASTPTVAASIAPNTSPVSASTSTSSLATGSKTSPSLSKGPVSSPVKSTTSTSSTTTRSTSVVSPATSSESSPSPVTSSTSTARPVPRSTQTSTASTSSTASGQSLPTLALDEDLDFKTRNYIRQYHQDQEAFEQQLSKIPVPETEKEDFDSLFDWEPFTDKKGYSKVTPISCDDYPRVFVIMSRIPGWVMPDEMAYDLRGAISGREGAQRWYQRFHPDDERRSEDDGHQKIILILKDGRARLEKAEKWPVLQERRPVIVRW